MRRPAKATVISLAALFFAVSGTAAGAATTGSLQLGQSNTAAAVTSLSNTTGSALSLSSTSTTPPLQVSNSVQVPNLNASLLGGHPASDFLTTGGTAANSNALGGTPAGSFIQGTGMNGGGGTITDAHLSVTSGGDMQLISTPDTYVDAVNSPAGSCQLQLHGYLNTSYPTWATWSNKDGTAQAQVGAGESALLNGSNGTYVVVVQVPSLYHTSTYTLTASYDAVARWCNFTAQAVTSNG